MSVWYERLSAQDRSFLLFEGPNTHMHVGGTTIFDLAPLRTAEGGVDIDRIKQHVAARLHWIPRYRQKLAFTPLNYPLWIDDERFNIHYHVRHASLPRPGDEQQLKRLAARILSQQLDRQRPLWEMWIVEGLEGDRFAMVMKTHHCVIDGIAGVDLMSVLMTPSKDDTGSGQPPPWSARPAPSTTELLRDEVVHQARGPLNVLTTLGSALRDPVKTSTQLANAANGVWDTLSTGLRSPDNTPLNRTIGPYRRCDWQSLSLREVKDVKNRLGGTVNDVIVATVTGAMRRFLERRRVNVEILDFRATVPVNIRTEADRHSGGNRVSAWLVTLPIHERDPLKAYGKIHAATTRLKETKQAATIELLTQAAALVDPILSIGIRLAARMSPYNLIITNVPGPAFPLYFLGAEMLEGYPMVPLFENQGLGMASFGYAGKLFWGYNADWDLVPDVSEFSKAMTSSFRELHEAAVR